MVFFVLLTTPPYFLPALSFFTFKSFISCLHVLRACGSQPCHLPVFTLHVEQFGLPLNFLHRFWFSQLSRVNMGLPDLGA